MPAPAESRVSNGGRIGVDGVEDSALRSSFDLRPAMPEADVPALPPAVVASSVAAAVRSPASLAALDEPLEPFPDAPGTSERTFKSPTISLSFRPMTTPPCETRSAPVTRRLAPARPKLLAARFRFGMTGLSVKKLPDEPGVKAADGVRAGVWNGYPLASDF